MFKKYKQTRKLEHSKLTEDEWYDVDSNGRGIIDVGAENYDDIFSYYDLDGESVLEKEFDSFLEAKADAIPLDVELALHFHVTSPSKIKRKEIESAVKNNYKREIRALNRKIHRLSVFTLYMLVMSIFWFGLWTLSKILNWHFVIEQLFTIISWVFTWEVVNCFFIERRDLKIERLKKYRFVRSDIDVYEYKRKNRRAPANFGNNVKTLNNLLNKVEKNEQNLVKKLDVVQGNMNTEIAVNENNNYEIKK